MTNLLHFVHDNLHLYKNIDLRDIESQKIVREIADKLINDADKKIKILKELEKWICDYERKFDYPPTIHLAVKLAISRLEILSIKNKTSIGIVVPVYHEHIRIRPNKKNKALDYKNHLDEHPEGENFVIAKHLQLSWLFKNSKVRPFVLYVDDGCDLKSGELVKEIIKKNKIPLHKVIHLERYLKNKEKNGFFEILQEFKEVKHSQKAGAVYLGIGYLAKKSDIVIFTDADLSYDLGLSGLLIKPILENKAKAVVVNRRDQLSYSEDNVVISETELGKRRLKSIIGSLRAALIGKLVPDDTQPGFKAFAAKEIYEVVKKTNKVRNFSFDIQLLARHALLTSQKALTVPIICLDSKQQTTADVDDTYIEMLRTLYYLTSEVKSENESSLRLIEKFLPEDKDLQMAIWLELKRLMNCPTFMINALENEGYVSQMVYKAQQLLPTDANNTSYSKVFEDEIYDHLSLLLQEISKKVQQRFLEA